MQARDRAFACLEEAVRAIESGDAAARRRGVQQAIAAITRLYLELGSEARGETAKSLADFFGYIVGRVLRIDLFDDARFAYQAMELLQVLYDSLRAATVAGDPAKPSRTARPRPDTGAAVIPLEATVR